MYQKVFNMLIIKRQLLARDHTWLCGAMAREAFDDNNCCRVRAFCNIPAMGRGEGECDEIRQNHAYF